MRVRQRTHVKSSLRGAVVFLCMMAALIVFVAFSLFEGLFGADMGILAALLIMFVAMPIGMIAENKEAIEKANRVWPEEEALERAREIHRETGLKKIMIEQEFVNQEEDIPPLGRMVYGDKMTIRKEFFFSD